MVAKEQVITSRNMSEESTPQQQQATPAQAQGIAPDSMVRFRCFTDWMRWNTAVVGALSEMGAPHILGSEPVPKKTGEEVPPQSEPSRKRIRRTWQPTCADVKTPKDGAGQGLDPYPMRALASTPEGEHHAEEGSEAWNNWARKALELDRHLEE
jgi:hypothetical protein